MARSPITVVILEHGSPPLKSRERQPGATANTLVIPQQAAEPLSMLASRVMHRLTSLERQGFLVTRATLSCSPNADQASLAARVRMTNAVVAAMETGDILLSAAGAHGPLRLQLLAIAGTITEMGCSPGLSVAVRLGPGSHSSSSATASVRPPAGPSRARRAAGQRKVA